GLRQKLAVDIRQSLTQTGTSAIYVTHDPDEAKTGSDRLAVREGGKILDLGPVSTLHCSERSGSVDNLRGGRGDVRGVVVAATEAATTVEGVDVHLLLPGRQGPVGDTVTVKQSR